MYDVKEDFIILAYGMQVLKVLLVSLYGPGSELTTAEQQACRRLLAVASAAVDDRQAIWQTLGNIHLASITSRQGMPESL